jgi:hypothetical protein
MGSPTGRANYVGVDIEFREYAKYIKGNPVYSKNHFGKNKLNGNW